MWSYWQAKFFLWPPLLRTYSTALSTSKPTKRLMLHTHTHTHTHTKRGGGGAGREVVVYWNLATLEMKPPMEEAETVSWGSVFQSPTVLGKNELRQ